MKLSPRETVLMLVTMTVILFAVPAFLARPKWNEWKRIKEEQKDIRWAIERYQRDVAEREKVLKELDSLGQMLQEFPANQEMDVHWLAIMRGAAAKNNLTIMKSTPGDEKRVGRVYELPIECTWEGSDAALTRFLFDLQSKGAMMDVRQLLAKPKSASSLRGRLSLSCAYRKKEK